MLPKQAVVWQIMGRRRERELFFSCDAIIFQTLTQRRKLQRYVFRFPGICMLQCKGKKNWEKSTALWQLHWKVLQFSYALVRKLVMKLSNLSCIVFVPLADLFRTSLQRFCGCCCYGIPRHVGDQSLKVEKLSVLICWKESSVLW